MATVCAATHIRDEALILGGVLGGWLETHSAWADELLVVDTGSTDRSVEIANVWGAHLRTADIEQGFDVVRSQCIEFAREIGSTFVAILDADERILPVSPLFALHEEPMPIDMTKEWPAGPGAPTHCRYEAIVVGYVNQARIIRAAIEDESIVAYKMRRRHWFDERMQRPCQPWVPVGDTQGIEDWQLRFVRANRPELGLHYVRRVHEWLRDANGREPEPCGSFGPHGPFIDHFHVPAKRLTPGRAEQVSALCNRLYEGDHQWKATY